MSVSPLNLAGLAALLATSAHALPQAPLPGNNPPLVPMCEFDSVIQDGELGHMEPYDLPPELRLRMQLESDIPLWPGRGRVICTVSARDQPPIHSSILVFVRAPLKFLCADDASATM